MQNSIEKIREYKPIISPTFKKLDYIDALRGIAVLMVLFVHTLTFLSVTNLNIIFRVLAEQGRMGVQLFYMASAFTLFYSISERNKILKDKKINHNMQSLASKIESKNFSNLEFFIRRFFRIAPMFYIAIIYYFWQYTTFPMHGIEAANLSTFTFSNLLSHFTFSHGVSPYWINTIVPGGWSVGVEMMFYLLVPTFYFAYKKYGVKFLYCALGISILISWIFAHIIFLLKGVDMSQFWHAFIYYNIFNQMPVFILGMIIYHNISNNNSTSNLSIKNFFLENKNINIISIFSIVLFTLSLYLNKITIGGIFAGSMLMLTCLLGYFVLVLSKCRLKIFVNKFFIYIGKISYSMYLTHFAFLSLLPFLFKGYFITLQDYFGSEFTFILSFVLLSICTALISSLTYKYVEKPGIILGNKITERLKLKSEK